MFLSDNPIRAATRSFELCGIEPRWKPLQPCAAFGAREVPMRIARCIAPAARALPCSRRRKEDITLQIEMGENLLEHSTIAEERLLTRWIH
jgi:hypothetical protein